MRPLPGTTKLNGCVDLHLHSTASDGTDSPGELVSKAVGLGLAAIALTDHDTLAGIPEAREAAKTQNIELVPGCELSTNTPFGEMHLLAFWPAETPEALAALRIQEQNRHVRNMQILERLADLGINISDAELQEEANGDIVGRPHIASILLRQGTVGSTAEAFARYLGRDGAAFVPRQLLTPLEGLRLLQSFNAVTAVAHPMLLRAPLKYIQETVFDLAGAGLDALEAYHSEHNNEQVCRVVKMAGEHDLLLSGGSDYHGLAKPRVAMGKGKGGLRVSSYILDKLKERRETKRKVSG